MERRACLGQCTVWARNRKSYLEKEKKSTNSSFGFKSIKSQMKGLDIKLQNEIMKKISLCNLG